MSDPTRYHTPIRRLTLFSAAALSATAAALVFTNGALALEERKIEEVWPVGQKQQYFYYANGNDAGESWLTIERIPRTRDRYLMMNTIDVDGVPYGSSMKLKGHAIAELDAWGRPVSYDLELERPQGVTTINVTMNFPYAEMQIEQPGAEPREISPRYNENSRLLDFVFIGPFDLAFRLQPVNPAVEKVRRNYFVPQLEVNVLTDFLVQYEETIQLLDGTEVPTVKLDLPALLTNVWLDPKGRVVKAEVPSERLVIHIGETVTP